MRIDEKVRDAHLEHFCPGGLGLAVTTPRPAWPGRPGAAPPMLDGSGNAARAAGQRCGRCGLPVAPGQDVRRRVSGTWVHESCPA
ncbi:MAG TPA: hypothetical protein VLL69_05755 [Streptosporangiaceae bacterium]|jgi:hypothetical protein|nr:hypothetical protein [Streptosporangiaceae bacterium]